jgi:SAM-dependent methyltransferase
MDTLEYNRQVWDRLVDEADRWTVPVSAHEIAQARAGHWSIILTPTQDVPRSWFPDEMAGLEVLCLAGGGGQQGPVLAAVGAHVTILDYSRKQLAQDQFVASRDGLELRTVEGDMKDLSCFDDQTFDLIVHPCSNCFVDEIQPVWNEAFRVLKRGGSLLSGITNPVTYLMDPYLEKEGVFQLKYSMPYSDLTSLTALERETYFYGDPINFGHSLEAQIGGQLAAGFQLAGFYEDDWGGKGPIDKYLKGFFATRAVKGQV